MLLYVYTGCKPRPLALEMIQYKLRASEIPHISCRLPVVEHALELTVILCGLTNQGP